MQKSTNVSLAKTFSNDPFKMLTQRYASNVRVTIASLALKIICCIGYYVN